MEKDARPENVSIPFDVMGHTFYATANLEDVEDAFRTGGETGVDSYLDEMVWDRFNAVVSPSYDTYEFMEDIQEKYGIDLGV